MSAASSKQQTGRASDRRDLIRDNAAALFAERGVSRTSVRDIADTVGILSGSLYHHFSSKSEMVDEIISTYMDELLRRFHMVDSEQDPRAALEQLIRVLLDMTRHYPHATLIYQNDTDYLRQLPSAERIGVGTAEIQRIWMGVIERGIAAGAFRDSLDAGVVYRLMRDSIWLTLRWFDPNGPFSLEQLGDQCIKIFIDGIATD